MSTNQPTRLYIAGPMTGLAEFNYPAFKEAASSLEEAGFSTANPANVTPGPNPTWADYMRLSIPAMLTCHGVATLPGWHNSRGAWLEVIIARELGMPVRTVEEWLTHLYCECAPCLTSDNRLRSMP